MVRLPRRLLGMVSQLDDAIARILAHRASTGGRAPVDTYADHGDARRQPRMMNSACVMYEELVHVPLVVAWPGQVAPGRRATTSWCLIWGAALLELAGLAQELRRRGA